MRILLLFALGASSLAAADTKVSFTLNTTDRYGAPIQQSRYYYVTRPDGLPKTRPAPMVLVFAAVGNSGVDGLFRDVAAKAGFLIVSCAFTGNSDGGSWVNDNSSFAGNEDYDYVAEVIRRVRESENGTDAFVAGLSKGGHMALAYACERPSTIRAAASIDEFMQQTNYPSAPVPVIMFHGTADANVAYAMAKDTLDRWRAYDGLLRVAPVMTYESSPLAPGAVTQATWRGGVAGTQVSFVTIVGGMHEYATPSVRTGYDEAAGAWAFFSRFLTPAQDAPRVVAQPVANVQLVGSAASFHVVANAAGAVAYQWQRNGADIPGATQPWYTTPPTTSADDGATFRAIVTNAAGIVTSASATLTVKPAPAAPVISSQPRDAAAGAGQSATFAVSATGTAPVKYQWTKNGVPLAGATDASLTIPALPSDSGAAFRATVTSAEGSASTSPAGLTVISAGASPVILRDPARVRTLVNQPGTFSVKAWSPAPMTYQWQKGTFAGNMADIPGATQSTYTFAHPALADHLTLVRCIVSNAAGAAVSASEMLFVTAAPVAPTQITTPLRASAQAGTAFQYDIVVTGGTAPLTYTATPLPPGLALDSATGRISGAPAVTGPSQITIGASNPAGAVSATLTLTVTAAPAIVSLEDWRLAYFGASAGTLDIAGDAADPDHDGCTNRQEYEGGSDPLDAASVPAGLPAFRRSHLGCPERPRKP